MNPRVIHILNRLLAPVVDLAFVLVVVALVFFGIGWFYDTVLPWMASASK